MNKKSFNCYFLLALVISACLLDNVHANAIDNETENKQQLYTPVAADAALRGRGGASGAVAKKEGIGAGGGSGGVGPWKYLVSDRVINIGNLINPPQTRCPCSCADPVGREPVGVQAVEAVKETTTTTTTTTNVVEEAARRMSSGVLVQLLPAPDAFPERAQICMRMSMAMVLVDLEPNNFGCVSTCG